MYYCLVRGFSFREQNVMKKGDTRVFTLFNHPTQEIPEQFYMYIWLVVVTVYLFDTANNCVLKDRDLISECFLSVRRVNQIISKVHTASCPASNGLPFLEVQYPEREAFSVQLFYTALRCAKERFYLSTHVSLSSHGKWRNLVYKFHFSPCNNKTLYTTHTYIYIYKLIYNCVV